jgi:hypothetical protein
MSDSESSPVCEFAAEARRNKEARDAVRTAVTDPLIELVTSLENVAEIVALEASPNKKLITMRSLSGCKRTLRKTQKAYPFPVLQPANFRPRFGSKNPSLALSRLYPEVYRLIRMVGGLVAAGDAVSHAYRPVTGGLLPDGADVYVVAKDETEADRIRRLAVANLNVYYAEAGACQVSVRTVAGVATTVVAMWEANMRAPAEVRLHLRVYGSTADVLSAYATPTVAYLGDALYVTTPLGALMTATGVAIYNETGMFERCAAAGWAIGFPQGRLDGLPNAVVMVAQRDDATNVVTGQLADRGQDARLSVDAREPRVRDGIDTYTYYRATDENLRQLLNGTSNWVTYEWIAQESVFRGMHPPGLARIRERAGPSDSSLHTDCSSVKRSRAELRAMGMRPCVEKSAVSSILPDTVGSLFPRAAFDQALSELAESVVEWQAIGARAQFYPNAAFVNMRINAHALRKLGLTAEQVNRFEREMTEYRMQVGPYTKFSVAAALEPFLERVRARYAAEADKPVARWASAPAAAAPAAAAPAAAGRGPCPTCCQDRKLCAGHPGHLELRPEDVYRFHDDAIRRAIIASHASSAPAPLGTPTVFVPGGADASDSVTPTAAPTVTVPDEPTATVPAEPAAPVTAEPAATTLQTDDAEAGDIRRWITVDIPSESRQSVAKIGCTQQ